MTPKDNREVQTDVILWELTLGIIGVIILLVGLPLAFFLA